MGGGAWPFLVGGGKSLRTSFIFDDYKLTCFFLSDLSA